MPTIERIPWPDELRRIARNRDALGEYDRRQLLAAAGAFERPGGALPGHRAARIALGPHTDSLCRPLEPGESVEVVNEGDRPAWLCVDAWTTRAALEATRQRDEAIGRAEAAEAEAGRLKLVLTATEHERAAAIARADNPEAEAGRLRSALVELVRLKGLKEQGGPGAMAEHDRCKRAAWHAAYAALYPGDPEATTDEQP